MIKTNEEELRQGDYSFMNRKMLVLEKRDEYLQDLKWIIKESLVASNRVQFEVHF